MQVLSRFFDYYFWGRDEERRAKDEGRGKTEDGGQTAMLDTSTFAESSAFTKGYGGQDGGQAILDAQ